MRDIRQHLASANQRTVLSETASALLEEDGRSVDDWVSNQIEKEILHILRGPSFLQSQFLYTKREGPI